MLFSEYEGLPVSLIEATMMGLPIICNDVGGNTEIAINDYNALVCNDWDGLLSVLNRLEYIDEGIYKQMSKNSREQYLKYFSFGIFKSKYIDYLSKL
jgi:glycosyltransferase involved in cell wall biosynthesis